MSTQRYRLLNAILLAALFAGSVWAYPRLPERIPVHFGLTGEPDAWAMRSAGSWFMLPALAAALALLMHVLSAYGSGHPETWNLPDKRRFLALSRAEQAPIVARMQNFIARTGCVLTALFGMIQTGIWFASTGSEQWLPLWVTAGIAGSVLIIVAGALRLNGVVGRMVREAHTRAVA